MGDGKTFELTLDKVVIDREEIGRDGAAKRMVIATLVWPRAGVAEKISTKALDFTDNTADIGGSEWSRRILFKENVSGPFGIEIAVSECLTESQIGEFFRFLGSALFRIAGAEAEDIQQTSLGGALAKVPFQYLSKVVGDAARYSPGLVASGVSDLDSGAELGTAEEPAVIELPLKACRAVYEVRETRDGREMRTDREAIIEAGEEVGKAVLRGKLY